jgi:hypothetical protein
MFDSSEFVSSDEFGDELDNIDLIALELEFSSELSFDPDELDDIPY